MKKNVTFLKELPPPSPINPVTVELVHYPEEVEVRVTNSNGEQAAVLGLRCDGTVVRYLGQTKNLVKMGFQVDDAHNGFIKMYN